MFPIFLPSPPELFLLSATYSVSAGPQAATHTRQSSRTFRPMYLIAIVGMHDRRTIPFLAVARLPLISVHPHHDNALAVL
ncbi:hypothetical protein OG21DRAFT_1504662 [Imleria badia]|nr:hypothetical protein OG21DRAFT_1504662 [Imleria badia]